MASPTPQPQDLTIVADVKAAMSPNIPTPSTSDDIIQQYITRCSDAIATYCSRTFQAQEYTENRNGYGTYAMRLKRIPAFQVNSVTVDNYVVPQSTNALTGGWWLDDDGKFIYIRGGLNFTAASAFCWGVGNIQFSYWAGYETPGQLQQDPVPTFPVSPLALPTDLQDACIEYVMLRMRQRTRIGDTGTSVGQERLNFYIKAMTPKTQMTLDNYKDNSYPLS
jgi:hypothetical protein